MVSTPSLPTHTKWYSLFSNMWDFFQVQVTAFMLKMSLAPITANGYIVNWFLIDANDISNINVATWTW